MVGLSPSTRLWLEKTIDLNINDPSRSEKMVKGRLQGLEFDQTVENSLIFLCGTLYGQGLRMERASGNFNVESEAEITSILKRRMYELREAYVSARLDT